MDKIVVLKKSGQIVFQFYLKFIQILSKRYPDFIKTLSRFYSNLIWIKDKIEIKSG